MTESIAGLRGKILIVDDQEANVLLLSAMLREAGYQTVTSTTDPTKVCELHLVHRYDLILLDLHMPKMDGFQVMENLKEIEPGDQIPVLVLTAQPEHKMRALRCGAGDFVGKPFDLAEVLIRIRNMLRVRFLELDSAELHARVLAEQRMAKRLLLGLQSDPGGALDVGPEVLGANAEGLIAASYAEVTLMFADVADFAAFSKGASARVLDRVLAAISTRVGGDAEASAQERADIIGDAYMDARGLPVAVVDHTIRAAKAAYDLAEAVTRLNGHSHYNVTVRVAFGADEPKAFQPLSRDETPRTRLPL